MPEGEDGERMASRWKRERRQVTELDFAKAEEVRVERVVMGADDRLGRSTGDEEGARPAAADRVEAGPVSVLRTKKRDYELLSEVRLPCSLKPVSH